MQTEAWPKEQHPLGQVKGPPALPFHPTSYEEAMERPHPEDDQSPQSPDGQAYDGPQSHYEEEAPQESGPQPQPQYEDISMDEEEEEKGELPEDQRGAQALPLAPREAMGIKASPAAYVPQSPKCIRDSEDEGAQDLNSDEDIEAPYLAPQKEI